VTRRAERAVWAAIDVHGTDGDGGVNPLTARYLNRLSDLLFILCRAANGRDGDVLWVPGGSDPT
jgi:cob(I)alamin adenosyltransferase